jgi:PAS domain S-box-containing protein
MSQHMHYGKTLLNSKGKADNLPQKYGNFFPGIVYTFDVRSGEVTYLNDKITQILGYTPEEFVAFPDNWLSIIHPDDLDFFKQTLDGYYQLRENESFSFIARYNHKDGGCKYLKADGTILETKMGKASSLIFFLQNVTDQVRFEEEANATRQLFDETEKLLLFGSWTWEARTGKITWTEGMCDLLEYQPDELTEIDHQFYKKHVLPEYLENLQSTVSKAINDKQDFEVELIIKSKTGVEKFVFTKGKPILDKDGNVKKYVGITRDVTNKKNAEKDRERRIRELNRSNKELEEFAYVASHDMHEPLRKILTFGEKINLKYSSALGEDGKIYLDRIVSSAHNMRNLIDNLLEFSKISRGKRAFELIDLNEIIHQVVSDQELRIEETGTKIKLKELPKVEAVSTELRQLFNNLLSNAIKFRKKDVYPVITISSHKLTHKEKSEWLIPFNQTYYKISIQDNGIGFESAYSEKIFEIFQRLHGKSEYSGSGIGLAICKKIVENHDGIIYATGETGIGSVFSIILPENQYN